MEAFKETFGKLLGDALSLFIKVIRNACVVAAFAVLFERLNGHVDFPAVPANVLILVVDDSHALHSGPCVAALVAVKLQLEALDIFSVAPGFGALKRKVVWLAVQANGQVGVLEFL